MNAMRELVAGLIKEWLPAPLVRLKCLKCGKDKPPALFNVEAKTKTGMAPYCRVCRRGMNNQYRSNPRYAAQQLLEQARRRSKDKGLGACTLTLEWVEDAVRAGRCQVSGLPLEIRPGRGRGMWSPSLDRNDPLQGYTPSNVRVVVWAYNAAKSIGTDEDVLRLAVALLSRGASSEGSI